eukprot:SAG22_NODE_121_length_19129_cov_36.644614_15_plen_134_part_00
MDAAALGRVLAVGARRAGDHEGRVVHPPPLAELRVEVRQRVGVDQQLAENVAVRRRPLEHAGELVLAAADALVALVPVVVKGTVQPRDLFGGEVTRNVKEALPAPRTKGELLSPAADTSGGMGWGLGGCAYRS